MPPDPNTERTSQADPARTDAPDPGGAHAKGYTADPDPAAPDLPDPVPLADAGPGGIHVPERDPGVQPTGRIDPDPRERIVSGGR